LICLVTSGWLLWTGYLICWVVPSELFNWAEVLLASQKGLRSMELVS
jgi:hypothetical protein